MMNNVRIGRARRRSHLGESEASQPRHEKKTSWQTQAKAVAIGAMRITGGAAAYALPSTPTLPMPQNQSHGRALLQGGASSTGSSISTPPPNYLAGVDEYCDWLFVANQNAPQAVFARGQLVNACQGQLRTQPEPLNYLNRERATAAQPGGGNFTRINVLSSSESATSLPLADHVFNGTLANVTAQTRAYVSPFWPRTGAPIDDGVVGAEIIAPSLQESVLNVAQRVFSWLFGQKLAHRNPLADNFDNSHPDLIANIPGLSNTISEDSQRLSPGLALNRWLKTINTHFDAIPSVSPWPSNLRYDSSRLWAAGTAPLMGSVVSQPQPFIDRYAQLPAIMTAGGLSQTAQNATLTAYRNVINYGLYNLGRPAI